MDLRKNFGWNGQGLHKGGYGLQFDGWGVARRQAGTGEIWYGVSTICRAHILDDGGDWWRPISVWDDGS